MPSEYLQVARYHARQLDALLLQLRDSQDGTTEPKHQTQTTLDILKHAQMAITALIVEMESRR